jgi:phage-related protein
LRNGENYTKHIVDDIWELRPGKYRFMFAIIDNYILLTYFKKDSKKTPKREIERAKKALRDWRDKNEKMV